MVSIRTGDRPPAEIERNYGEALEQALFAVSGIREVDQVARTGRLVATIGFDWETDMDLALVEVEKAVGPIRSDPDVDDVSVRRFDPRQAAVVVVGIVSKEGGPDLAELRRIARRQIAVALERLQGVAEVRVTGGREKEVRVLVEPYKAESHGLTIADLQRRLLAANVDINAGTLEEGSKVYLIRGLARYESPQDIADVVVSFPQNQQGLREPVHLGDVGRVELADRDISHLVRVNGREGVGLSIYKDAGANTVEVSRTVLAALRSLESDLPNVEVVLISDEATLIRDSIEEAQNAAIVGVVLAVLVLVLFLRSAGPTVLIATVVPVSLLGTLFVMHLCGQTLNVMTMAGLALGAGMLVDNGIVVVESIYRRLAAGDSLADGAARGTSEVAAAITASTLTTCAVFLPIVFVRGVAARLISGLSFTVNVSLLISLVAATMLIPALAAWLLPKGPVRAADPGKGRVERFVAALLKRPGLVTAAGMLLAAGSAIALLGLGTQLLPPADPRQFSLRVTGPPGQRVESTARVAEAIEGILQEAAGSDLLAILSEVGRVPEDDRLIREEQTEENTARFIVRLRPEGRSGGQVVSAAAAAVSGLEGIETSWETGSSTLALALGTSRPPIVVEIAGQSPEELRLAAAAALEALKARPELWNVRSSFEGGPPELHVKLDRPIADGLGVDLDLVASQLEASLDGLKTTTLFTGDEEQDVVLRLPRVRRDELLRVPMTTPAGARVVVGDVARLSPESGAREIFRRDQRRVARVTARIAATSDYPLAVAATQDALRAASLPPGLSVRVAGEEEERARIFGELRFAGLLALVLVFMVLAGTFESMVHPLTVISVVPLSLVGVALILVPLGQPIGVMEMLGLIVLAGVAVNDAVLLVDAARRLMAEGLSRRESLARAAGIRLRPIIMTTATTVLALLPQAVATGEAARLRSPLALTIIGGLVASTICCLVVVPCVYDLLDRLRPARRAA
jgi:HAE1 family hydrophobic/amphiphilic exporter-1